MVVFAFMLVAAAVMILVLVGVAYKRYKYPDGVQVEFASPRFHLDSSTNTAAAIKYLDDNGYVVIGSVADAGEIATAKDLLWSWLESLPDQGVNRKDPSSWTNWPGIPGIGLIGGSGVGQTPYMWYLRGLPRVRRAFEAVWGGDRSLLVSFDGCGIFRPWGINPRWKTKGGWFHTDQNSVRRPGKVCVQGLISLYDANATTGNLTVVPGSHLQFHRLTKLARHNKADFTSVPADHDIFNHCARPRLVHCRAGDLILWDSRTIHCNSPAVRGSKKPIPRTLTGEVDLLRAVGYVCMTPAAFANEEHESIDDDKVVTSSNDGNGITTGSAATTASTTPTTSTRTVVLAGSMTLSNLVKRRMDAVVAHVTTNHWPHMYFEGNRPPLKPNTIVLTPLQMCLVTGELPPP